MHNVFFLSLILSTCELFRILFNIFLMVASVQTTPLTCSSYQKKNLDENIGLAVQNGLMFMFT